ncbi:hypothetical protein [Vibrio spartinae]|uniref:Lipoprotein n=1 Tax=Vibrio spartinae TaxID=1918945 RepID=A0A1N6MA96_9VIBR|nr:hypothetical protein [Vibrio spartinae]SIO96323.1 hypothetical protein VSP9026_04107 [Vibrio spartinae]
MRVVTVLFLGGALVACTTTGDPRQGGLLGWDEDKAKLRQQALNDTMQAQKAEIVAIKMENSALAQSQHHLEQQLSIYQQELNTLISEKEGLLVTIKQLVQSNQLSETRYQSMLTNNPWLAKTREQVLLEFKEHRSEMVIQKELQKIAAENEQLTNEIIMLLGH